MIPERRWRFSLKRLLAWIRRHARPADVPPPPPVRSQPPDPGGDDDEFGMRTRLDIKRARPYAYVPRENGGRR